MPTITGASEKQPGIFWDNGGIVVHAMHPDYGVVGNGVANDRAGVQAAIDVAHAFPQGGTVVLPAKTLRCDTALTMYANVNLVGAGGPNAQTVLSFPTGSNGINLVCPAFNTNCGFIRDIYISGPGPATYAALSAGDKIISQASVGLRIEYAAKMRLERVMVEYFGTNYRIRDWDHITLDECHAGGYRGTAASIVFGDATTPISGYAGSTCNGIFGHNVWVSGGNLGTGAALQIDRATMVQWIGGNLESAGVGAKLAATNTGADGFRCSAFTFIGVDFENPTNHYVEVGTAELTPGAFALSGLYMEGINGSSSLSTTVTRGMKINSCRDFTCFNHGLVLNNGAGSGVAYFDFTSDQVHPQVNIGPAYNYDLDGGVYLKYNGSATSASVDEHVFGMPGLSTDARAVQRVASVTAERVTATTVAERRGSVSAATATPTSIFAPGATTGLFIIHASTNVALYNAVAFFWSTSTDNGFVPNMNNSGSANFAITNAGGNVSVTQSSGTTRTVTYEILRIA